MQGSHRLCLPLGPILATSGVTATLLRFPCRSSDCQVIFWALLLSRGMAIGMPISLLDSPVIFRSPACALTTLPPQVRSQASLPCPWITWCLHRCQSLRPFACLGLAYSACAQESEGACCVDAFVPGSQPGRRCGAACVSDISGSCPPSPLPQEEGETPAASVREGHLSEPSGAGKTREGNGHGRWRLNICKRTVAPLSWGRGRAFPVLLDSPQQKRSLKNSQRREYHDFCMPTAGRPLDNTGQTRARAPNSFRDSR